MWDNRSSRRWVVAVAAGVLLTACGGAVETTERAAPSEAADGGVATAERSDQVEEAPSPEPVASSEPTVAGGDAVEGYFRAFASGNPKDMRDMVKLSAKGTPARTYAQVQVALAAAQRAEFGSGSPPSTMEVVDGELELCNEPLGEVPQEECFRFADFETTDGKLASFTAAGEAIDGRIAKGGQTVEAGGTVVKLLGAYHSVQADMLIVAFEAEPGGQAISLEWYSAEYVDPDGATVAAITASGPDRLRSGRDNIGVVQFEQAPIGGTVRLPAYDNDFNELSVEFDL